MKTKNRNTEKRAKPIKRKRKSSASIPAAKTWRHGKVISQVSLPGFDSANPVEVPLVDRLREATQPLLVKVAPGKYAPALRNGKAPDMTICFWHRNEDGTVSPMPVTQRLVRLDSDVATLLGFAGQYNTLRRLGEAGFIEIVKAAPGFTLLNVDSWFNHLRRCAENPNFWDRKGKNFLTYKVVIF